ncbi:MAG: YlbE-like family protein [Anaeroplasmataceae bacterium]
MVLDYMKEIYQNPSILEYLRYHPKWYKILYYDNSKIKAFLQTAKKDLHITASDRLNNINKTINFINGFSKYMNKL